AALNPGQRQAVSCCRGPLLILAGAGSGKTRVIVHRIAYMIGVEKIPPTAIMAVTFTNKAAGEMRERVRRMIGPLAGGIWINTFHSTCARILRQHIARLGYSERFVIYDDKDQLSVIKEVYQRLNLAEQNFKPEAARSVIADAKNKGLEPAAFASRAATLVEERVAAIYQLYQQLLQANDALDFGDLHLLTVKLFQEHPEVLELFRQRFNYLLVDEYQDTNEIQYRLLRLLAAEHGNLCVVGDDDQSIYSWRGARLKNILDFEADYPEAKVIRLEENYRSTRNILAAANGVIACNRERKGKNLWTRNPTGELLSLYVARDEYDEARFIVARIRESGRELGDCAVFYRTNAQSRVLEETFSRQGMPYVIVGGFRFYERAEVKDLLAYLRVVNNARDSVSLLRIINVPPRGVGKKTVADLKQLAAERDCSLWEAVVHWAGDPAGGSSKGRRALAELVEQVEDWRRQAAPPSELFRQVLAGTGYLEWLQRGGNRHAFAGKRENIDELLNAILAWEKEQEQPSLAAYLESVALVSDVDRLEEGQSRVTLMTLHSAKGLEFPVVFMAGLEEGLFPNRQCYNRPAEMEEERRLCYVGMTRAREKLYLIACRSRQFQGVRHGCKPSRFLFDIPRELLVQESGDQPAGRSYSPAARPSAAPSRPRRPRPTSAPPAAASPAADDFPVGCKVVHAVFGPGVVAAAEGQGENRKLVIIFRDRGRKKISLRHASLTRA
ncbi:MAG: UvrD-helicase domain-containing protein, partial [Deltaproteobacteria bacterium]|nr:UvrD-helicase domain-containing protein [Deltaproteobacteria bacterium]